jgi:hypothetical protein
MHFLIRVLGFSCRVYDFLIFHPPQNKKTPNPIWFSSRVYDFLIFSQEKTQYDSLLGFMVSHNQLIVVGRWWWLVLCFCGSSNECSYELWGANPLTQFSSVQFSPVELLLLLLHISSGIISLSLREEKREFLGSGIWRALIQERRILLTLLNINYDFLTTNPPKSLLFFPLWI